MTLVKTRSFIAFSCDFCPMTTDEFGTDDFDMLRQSSRRAGWVTFKQGLSDTWEHKCPDCVEQTRRGRSAQSEFRRR